MENIMVDGREFTPAEAKKISEAFADWEKKNDDIAMSDEFVSWAKERFQCHNVGSMRIDVSPCGYDDRISPAALFQAYEDCSEYPVESRTDKDVRFALEDAIFEDSLSYVDGRERELFDEVLGDAERRDPAWGDAMSRLLPSEFLDLSGYEGPSIDLDGYLGRGYKVNFIFGEKKEINGDFVAAMSGLEGMKADECSLARLIMQQGHSPKELADPKGGFMESVADELDEACYSMGALTVSASMNGTDLVDLLDALLCKKERMLAFGKDAMAGIYNPWNGSGSLLGLALEKDAVLLLSSVAGIQIEGGGTTIGSYTVDQTYGLVGSCWRDCVKTYGVAENL